MEIAISIGIQEALPQLLEEIARRLDEGYTRSPGDWGSG